MSVVRTNPPRVARATAVMTLASAVLLLVMAAGMLVGSRSVAEL